MGEIYSALILASCQHIHIQSQQAKYYSNVQKHCFSIFFIAHMVSVPLNNSFPNVLEILQQNLWQSPRFFLFVLNPCDASRNVLRRSLTTFRVIAIRKFITPRWDKNIELKLFYNGGLWDGELIKNLFHIMYFL